MHYETPLCAKCPSGFRNRCVFSFFRKFSALSDGSRRSSGSAFQAIGPATENARRPSVLRRCRGTTRCCWVSICVCVFVKSISLEPFADVIVNVNVWDFMSVTFAILCFQYFGFVLYRHVFRENFYTAPLSAPGIRDRGYVLVNGVRWPMYSKIAFHLFYNIFYDVSSRSFEDHWLIWVNLEKAFKMIVYFMLWYINKQLSSLHFIRSTSESRPNNIEGKNVRPYVRPQKVSSIWMKFGI